MSRPRNPFGSTHPGRLPATMVKVLAAELSDPTRLRRGKQYAKDGSVLDIAIEPGAVVCEIQGSRPTPYIATVEVTPGDGMPLRRDITCRCTCPDDDNWDGHACKHVIAALFALSNELLLEPELLDVWRGRSADDVDHDELDHDESDHDDTPTRGARRHLSLVPPADAEGADAGDAGAGDADSKTDSAEPDRPFADPLHHVLVVPPGHALPDVPLLEPADLPPPKDRALADALGDALRHARVEWD